MFLKALDLLIVDWAEASSSTGVSAPTTADVIDAGMDKANASVVLFTPDDLGWCKKDFLDVGDDLHETSETGQARLNVIFEAGMVWARYRPRTVLVEIGRTRPMSDLDGVQMLRLNNTRDRRRTLRDRLRNAGLAVEDGDFGWTTAGNFGW